MNRTSFLVVGSAFAFGLGFGLWLQSDAPASVGSRAGTKLGAASTSADSITTDAPRKAIALERENKELHSKIAALKSEPQQLPPQTSAPGISRDVPSQFIDIPLFEQTKNGDKQVSDE